jgi:GTP-binding protein HflX
LNLLCEENILAQNKLFATLDPTTRRCKLPCGTEVLFTDTVGFINRLPHHLVEAFQSTLDEVVYSDLVLFVMDASDPKFFQKMQITENILEDLYRKRDTVPPRTLYLLNKCDLPESTFSIHAFPKAKEHLPLSAKTGLGKEALLEKIEAIIAEAKKSTLFFFPHEEAGKLSLLYRGATVNEVRYEADGIYAEALCDEKTRGTLAKFIKKD